MYEPFRLSNTTQLVHDRINDLYETACQLRGSGRTADERIGLVERTRWSLGRRLIRLGSVVSGHGV